MSPELLTLVEIIFVLLALLAASCSGIDLVTDTAEEATTAGRPFSLLLAALLLALVAGTASEGGESFVELVHDG